MAATSGRTAFKSNTLGARDVACRGTVIVLATFFAVFITALFPPAAHAGARQCSLAFASFEDSVLYRLGKGSGTFETADTLAREIQHQKPKKRAQAASAILSNYRKIPKRILDPSLAKALGPRRLADRVLTLINRYDLDFANRIQNGATPRAAFANMVSKNLETIGLDYSAEDIVHIVDALKFDLKARQAAMNRATLRILLAGSFVNGKADIRASDLDVTISDASLKLAKLDWQQKANEILKLSNPEASMIVELHGEPAAFYGALNPFVFEITGERVRLHVYGPASRGTSPIYLHAQQVTTYDWD